MKWQDISVDIKTLSPGACLYKIMKKEMYKIRLRRDFFFKLATNDQSGRMFLLTSEIRFQGVLSPCPGAIYMYKIMKKIYKIRLQRDIF